MSPEEEISKIIATNHGTSTSPRVTFPPTVSPRPGHGVPASYEGSDLVKPAVGLAAPLPGTTRTVPPVIVVITTR